MKKIREEFTALEAALKETYGFDSVSLKETFSLVRGIALRSPTNTPTDDEWDIFCRALRRLTGY